MPEAHPTSRPPRVLLVEDDPLQARGLCRLLEFHDAQVHTVASAGAALLAIASQPAYDLVISDLGLPGLSGAELARRLRHPVLVAYSGYDARRGWFDLALCKPAPERLVKLLRASRLGLSVVRVEEEDWSGSCREHDLQCRGRSAAHVLRMLAGAIESREPEEGPG